TVLSTEYDAWSRYVNLRFKSDGLCQFRRQRYIFITSKFTFYQHLILPSIYGHHFRFFWIRTFDCYGVTRRNIGIDSTPLSSRIDCLAITLGSAISILLSPLIMPIIALSGVNGLSGFKNGIRFNWKYALILYIVGQIYVQGSVLL